MTTPATPIDGASEKKQPARRPRIIYSGFPIHLFANAAYYYCWELSDRYDITLLVEEGCEAHPAIQTLLAHGRIARIVSMPRPARPWALHRWACRDMAALLAETQPVAVIQSNFQYYWNKHIFRSAKKVCPEAQRIVVQSCQILLDISIEQGLREVEGILLARAARRCPFIPFSAFKRLYGWLNRLRLFRDFTLFPMLLTGRRLKLTLDELGARVVSRDMQDLFDHVFCYTPAERDGYGKETDNREALRLVTHPFTSVPEARQALYPDAVRDGSIVALPSRCFDFALLRADSFATEAQRIADLWCLHLERIRAQIGGGKILWKLHPVHANEPLMAELTRNLADRMSDFTIVPPTENAERLMISADAIVSETSTTLIWASRLGDRAVFSLDVFGVPGGGEMRHYPGITVVRGDGAGPGLTAPPPPPAYPTVTEMLDQLLPGRPGATLSDAHC